MCAHKYPGALMSVVLWCHECLSVLMSAHSLVAPCSWLLLCSNGCSLLHGTKLMSVHGCSWVFNGYQELSWRLLAAYGCLWVHMSAHDCSLVALIRSHELGAIDQWTLMRAPEQSWAWHHEAMSTHQHSSAFSSAHGTIAPYSWVLLGTHEHT